MPKTPTIANAPSAPSAASQTPLRTASASDLAEAMTRLRGRLMQVWTAFRQALPAEMTIRYQPELNPPRWELGHIAWFEEYWIARNTQRQLGCRADPLAARAASVIPRADALFNSSLVPHAKRWHLDLPDAWRTERMARQVRERSLALLAQTEPNDDSLYFFRLTALHEAMHLEAWIYMAQNLALDLRGTGLTLTPPRVGLSGTLDVTAQKFALGQAEAGFAFDNELTAHEVELPAFQIDTEPVTWGRYLPFIEAGGYEEQRYWTGEGWAWRQRNSSGKPRHLLCEDGRWKRAVFGQWADLDPQEPATHLSAHEAHAWCCWAGRRLPSEAEWECAAISRAEDFSWGQVWEWTSSGFAPYPGFKPHPYEDYSQPWFDGRPVLRGSSFATWPGLSHPRYRNYFTADRTDIFAGFRSCAA